MKTLFYLVFFVLGFVTLEKSTAAPGDLDLAFNSIGYVRPNPIMGGSQDEARGVAVLGDGRIVAVGFSHNASGYPHIAVLRYHANGVLDTTFNGSGIVTTKVSVSGSGGDWGKNTRGRKCPHVLRWGRASRLCLG